jgi:hypothetical protein
LEEVLMTDIVHDYPEIAKALKGDNWWRPEPKLPLTELLKEQIEKNEPATMPLQKVRTNLPPANWRLLHDRNRRP